MKQTKSATPTITSASTTNSDNIQLPRYVQRFLDKIEVSEGHWLYTGARSGNGYGVCSVEGRDQLAHRASYSFFVDDLPGEGYVIGHASGCPRHCVNPEHLSAITHKQNQQQRITDGTMYVVRRSPVKATAEEVADIRARAAKGESRYSIGKIWNRAVPYISAIVSGKIHKIDKPAKAKKIIRKMPKPAPTSSIVMKEAA